MNILLIEDSEFDRYIFKKAFENAGLDAELSIAEDGLRGIELLKEKEFSCIFIDYSLPIIDGLEVLKKIRVENILAPVIIISSLGDEAIAVQAIKSGATDYITKNLITPEGLSQVLRNALKAFYAEQRKLKAEADLEQEKQKIQLYLGIAKIIFVVLDKEKRITFINENGSMLLGCKTEEIIGKPWIDNFIPEYLRETINSRFNEMAEYKINPMEHYENPVLTRSGEERIIAWKNAILRDESGNLIAVISSGEDVTDYKKNETELQEAALRIKDLYDNAPCGYHSINREGFFTEINQTELNWLGYSREEIIGIKKFEEIISTESAIAFKENFRTLIEQGSCRDLEYIFVRKDGTTFPIILNVVAMYDDNNEFVQSRASVFDNTGPEKSKSELIKSKQLAEELLQVKEQFLANMSHEIRTPLNGIVGLTEILLASVSDPEQREYLSALKSSADNLLIIINDILDISKIESGKMELEETEFNARKIIRSNLNIFLPKAAEKNISLSCIIDENTPQYLKGDPFRLNQIIMNLISNAIKFTTEGEVKLIVSCKGINENNIDMEFVVTDTGIGIPEEKIETIFDTFTQASAETARKFGGTGLGLAIVRRLVTLQGGKVTVTSQLNKGSEFKFNIPFKPGRNISQNEIKEIRNVSLDGLKILVVDDNQINQVVAKKLLSSRNATVEIAFDGNEAIDILNKRKFDIILLDIQMPGKDGYETNHHIRNTMKLNTPIIAMTAYASQNEEEKCLQAGMNGYLSKPFKPAELYNMILDIITIGHDKKNIKKELLTDLSFLDELSDGNQEFKKEMIETFILQSPDIISEIKSFSNAHDWVNISKLLHKIKPGIGYMGSKKLMEEVHYIMEMAKNKPDNPELMTKILNFTKIFESVIEELGQALSKLN